MIKYEQVCGLIIEYRVLKLDHVFSKCRFSDEVMDPSKLHGGFNPFLQMERQYNYLGCALPGRQSRNVLRRHLLVPVK